MAKSDYREELQADITKATAKREKAAEKVEPY